MKIKYVSVISYITKKFKKVYAFNIEENIRSREINSHKFNFYVVNNNLTDIIFVPTKIMIIL